MVPKISGVNYERRDWPEYQDLREDSEQNLSEKISENETDLKTAYEVSISKMEVERLQEASGE